MSDDFEDDTFHIEHRQLVDRGFSPTAAWDLLRDRDRRAQADQEAADWSHNEVRAARRRLVEAHPLFALPDDDII